jgi:hypothetical protein
VIFLARRNFVPNALYLSRVQRKLRLYMSEARGFFGAAQAHLAADPRASLSGDNTYAALERLDAVHEAMGVTTRMRLDSAFYQPAPPRRPEQSGRPRKQKNTAADLAPLLSGQATAGKQSPSLPGAAKENTQSSSPLPKPSGRAITDRMKI